MPVELKEYIIRPAILGTGFFMAATKKQQEAIGKAQFKLYEDIELPALINLIEWAVRKTKRRNYTSLIEEMNSRLKTKQWPPFSNSELSALLAPASETTRRTGWSDRTKFRLVVGLGLHDNLVTGLVLLQLHLHGLIDLTELKNYDRVMEAIEGKDPHLSAVDADDIIQEWASQASDQELRQLAHHLIDCIGESGEQKTAVQTLLDMAVADNEIALYRETPFTAARIKKLIDGTPATEKELEILGEWASKHYPNQYFDLKHDEETATSGKRRKS
ncbi:MAG: hypothetical protein AAF329_01955 [Cyanobacteria bacterium P01_A01_bin.17]